MIVHPRRVPWLKFATLSIFALSCVNANANAQTSSSKPPAQSVAKPAQTKPSPNANSSIQTSASASAAPLTIERYSTKVRFETDGTGERIQEVRVKAMNDAGVKQLQTLTFSYNSEHETFALAYLRIKKPDGSVTEEKPDAMAKMIDDQPAPAVKGAANFKEIREVDRKSVV